MVPATGRPREIEMTPLGAFKEGIREGSRQATTCFGRVFCCLSSGESAPLRPNVEHSSIQAEEEKTCLEKTALVCGYCCVCVFLPCLLTAKTCREGRCCSDFPRTRSCGVMTGNALIAAVLCSPLWGTGLWLAESGTSVELGKCLASAGCALPCLMGGYAITRYCLCPCCFDEEEG